MDEQDKETFHRERSNCLRCASISFRIAVKGGEILFWTRIKKSHRIILSSREKCSSFFSSRTVSRIWRLSLFRNVLWGKRLRGIAIPTRPSTFLTGYTERTDHSPFDVSKGGFFLTGKGFYGLFVFFGRKDGAHPACACGGGSREPSYVVSLIFLSAVFSWLGCQIIKTLPFFVKEKVFQKNFPWIAIF